MHSFCVIRYMVNQPTLLPYLETFQWLKNPKNKPKKMLLLLFFLISIYILYVHTSLMTVDLLSRPLENS